MSLAVLATITKGVVDQLNGHTFTPVFTAKRVIVPVFNVDTTPTALTVLVGSADQAIDLSTGTRAISQDLYTAQIGVFNQISRGSDGELSTSEVDVMLYLVQQIVDFLKANEDVIAEGANKATLIAVRNKPVYDPAQLDKTDTFQSVLSLDYRFMR